MIHCMSVSDACSSDCSTGNATLTAVPSMNVRLDPMMVATSVQRLGCTPGMIVAPSARHLLASRGCCDVAHMRESTLAVLLVRTLDVVHAVANERPLRHDGRALGLAGIQHEARAFLLCGDAHDTDTITAKPIE